MKTLIYGNGVSGQTIKKILQSENVDYDILDKRGGVNVKKKLKKYELNNYNRIIFSPGINVNDKVLTQARDQAIEVMGELEYGYRHVGGDIITVTGTNGKTSTVRVIGEILARNHDVALRGNIGEPLSMEYFGKHEICVVEASSFQLQSVEKYKSKINILLNVAPNHLDVHKDMDEYVHAKFNMFKNNDENTINIINFDNQIIMSNIDKIVGNIIYISLCQKVHGIYIKNGCIYNNIDDKNIKLCKVGDIHQNKAYIYNFLVGVVVGLLYDVNITDIIDTINQFKVSVNRQEIVNRINGVTYINDSKSTNVASTINCISNIESPVILLMGGKSKQIPYDDIFKLKSLPKYIIAFGKSRKEIVKCAKINGYKNILSVQRMKDSVTIAKRVAESGDYVVLSPACSSFDEFNSYSERGDKFKEYVRNL